MVSLQIQLQETQNNFKRIEDENDSLLKLKNDYRLKSSEIENQLILVTEDRDRVQLEFEKLNNEHKTILSTNEELSLRYLKIDVQCWSVTWN